MLWAPQPSQQHTKHRRRPRTSTLAMSNSKSTQQPLKSQIHATAPGRGPQGHDDMSSRICWPQAGHRESDISGSVFLVPACHCAARVICTTTCPVYALVSHCTTAKEESEYIAVGSLLLHRWGRSCFIGGVALASSRWPVVGSKQLEPVTRFTHCCAIVVHSQQCPKPHTALHESTLVHRARAESAGQSFPTLWWGPSSWG